MKKGNIMVSGIAEDVGAEDIVMESKNELCYDEDSDRYYHINRDTGKILKIDD